MNDWDAAEGKLWVCLACGRMAKNRNLGGLSPGWDVACFLNSVEVEKDKLSVEDGRVAQITSEEAPYNPFYPAEKHKPEDYRQMPLTEVPPPWDEVPEMPLGDDDEAA